MPLPNFLHTFDIAAASVTVWVFKKSPGANGATIFTGRWIETDEALEAALRITVMDARARITEIKPYGLLATNQDDSVLQIDAIETHAHLVVAQAGAEVVEKRVRKLSQIQNAAFYVIKLTSGQDVLYAVRKSDTSWRSKSAAQALSVFFAGEVLGLNEAPGFSLSKYVDFFIADTDILIADKAHFESVLNYKQAHADDFVNLQAEQAFSDVFSDLAPLIAFVGTNKLHLRRLSAIHQKGHYQDQQFLTRLYNDAHQYGLNIQFDAAQKIVPTEATCGDIITALLDHRLLSPFSTRVYDVPNTEAVP